MNHFDQSSNHVQVLDDNFRLFRRAKRIDRQELHSCEEPEKETF